jgi:hypothetical protein
MPAGVAIVIILAWLIVPAVAGAWRVIPGVMVPEVTFDDPTPNDESVVGDE